MPTTTNFGWTTPADTDLVKDGALAIRTLGNGVDTSLVDLKGGTTGQALTKATNTDLDYSWTDIIPASSAFFAGKNKILNSNFSIWQRGTTFNGIAASTYCADRWLVATKDAGITLNVTQQTFSPGSAPVSGYEGATYIQLAVTASGSNNSYYFGQKIEDVRTFAGQTVTLSYWAKVTSGTFTPTRVFLNQQFGSGGSAEVDNIGNATPTYTTTWTRYTQTISVPSISGKTIGTGSNLYLLWQNTSSAAYTLQIWGVQLEAGSTATAFQTATGNPASELAACQRYYQRYTVPGTDNAIQLGNAYSTTAAMVVVRFPVFFRTTPSTTLEYSGMRLQDIGSGTYYTFTAASISGTPTNSAAQLLFTGATGLTQYRPYLLAANATTDYFALSAEL